MPTEEEITTAVRRIEWELAQVPAEDQVVGMNREIAKLPIELRGCVEVAALMALKAHRLQMAANDGTSYIKAAKPIIILGLVVIGIVGFACVLGGIFAIYRNATSPSEVTLFGNKLTTGHVGVAFVFIGVVVLGAVIRKAFKTTVQLGQR